MHGRYVPEESSRHSSPLGSEPDRTHVHDAHSASRVRAGQEVEVQPTSRVPASVTTWPEGPRRDTGRECTGFHLQRSAGAMRAGPVEDL